ncbi:MAG TPA: hypothetical protein VHA82_23830 [Ramlibacter sp.]|uniref:hypothetical protein n=1 Tax=Ramlibacter sp. TaxID=1917967 RepID=UPI002C980606|nr:hypothetical protein [Ramlibacter sp.]HVZ46858.1 hypothetical protein [Ramlibacter sp.]
MPLTFTEEIELRAAFMEIQRERKESLRQMFTGTQLVAKSRVEDAKTLAKEAKAAKEKVGAIPGVGLPELDMPSFNVKIFDGIDLRRLVNVRIPTLRLPGVDLSWIPDVRLGSIPGFSLPTVRLNLKGILKYKDLFPDISLRALAWQLAIKWPDLNFPSLMLDLSRILAIDFDLLFPDLKVHFPEFFRIDLRVSLPSVTLPDINFPSVPNVDLPEIDLSGFDFSGLHVPDVDFPRLLKVPGFDKVLKLLMEVFDSVDLHVIIAELGVEFFTDFVSSALPIVQQVKSGAQAAQSWGKAAQDWHKSRKTKKQREFLVPGNARDACDAVGLLLRNSRDEHAALAAIQTTQLAVSTAGLFADLGGATGPAVSAAAAVAKLLQKVIIMAARYKEMKAVNKILSTTPERELSSNIFQVSPLLGCYYLANNTTSTVLNVMSDNILEDDWMTEWEGNKRRHLEPLLRECTRFISESRYVLTPLRQTQGMYVKLGFTEKLKKGAELYVKKKLGRAPQHATVPSHRFVGR